MSQLIVLDAGHGGFDNGATHEGRNEKDDTLKLTLAVGNRLRAQGMDIYYIRDTDVFDSPVEKARIANDVNGDLLVSIHRNLSAMPNTYSGAETLIQSEGGIKEQVAKRIINSLERVGFVNLGVNAKASDALLRRAQMPAVMVKVGFINTDEDNLLLDEKFDEIALAISNGIVESMMSQSENYPFTYRVQVGGFRNEENAQKLAYQLFQDGYQSTIANDGRLFLVQVGEIYSLDQAVMLEQLLRLLGYDTFIISESNPKAQVKK